MFWQANPYSFLLFISTGVALVVAVIAWNRRRAPGAAALALLLLAVAAWCGGYGLYWALAQGQAQLMAGNATTIGAALVPPTFLAFMLDVTGRRRWLTRGVYLTLGLTYGATLLASWTNASHHLWHTAIDYRVSGGLHVIATESGPLYWLFSLVYAYSLILAGTALLVHAWWHARGIYRSQYALLLVAVAVALGPSLLSEAGWTPWPELDLAPLGLAVSGPLLAYALFHYRLLDLVPIARTLLVDTMLDAVIVLDQQQRVIDLNPAALKLTGWQGRSPIGQPAQHLFAAWPDLVTRYTTALEAEAQVYLDAHRTLHLSITPLHDPSGAARGRLIVLRDISAQKEAERDLQAANTVLHTQLTQIATLQLELQAQAIHDALTGLYNRHFLAEILPRELARADREAQALSIIFIDLDHFKAVNDTYGHAAGDRVLQAVGQFLAHAARGSDVVCRYGGEEIIIVCPGMTLTAAAQRAEQWRQSIAGLLIDGQGAAISVTISAGLAAFPPHGTTPEAIIQAADGALYAAKAAGRNCVRAAPLPPNA